MSKDTKKYFEDIREGNILNVMLHLQSGIDIDSRDEAGMSGLMAAIDDAHDQIAEMFIERKADLYCRDISDETALAIAVYTQNTNIINKILDTGFDINSQASGDHTVLYNATALRDHTIVDLLLSRGADPTRSYGEAQSALEIAIGGDYEFAEENELVKKLRAYVK